MSARAAGAWLVAGASLFWLSWSLMPGVGVTDARRILLLIGAMGSAADAVFHLLALAMTSPDLDRTGFVELMQVVQGPGLLFILPLIAAFFVGSVWLSVALARLHLVSHWSWVLHGLALGVGVAGGVLAPRAGVATRAVGLVVLALIAGAQAWMGLAL